MTEENLGDLSIDERCLHNNWKVRMTGYSDALKLFSELEDYRSEDWDKYVPLVKNFVVDSNDPALEKGLEAVLVFIEKSFAAVRTAVHVVPGLVKKCLASSRARTRNLALQICLMYVEIGKRDVVIDELLKGSMSKNPKICVACLRVITETVNAFGSKVVDVSVSTLLQKVPNLLEDRDQNVRIEAKQLLVELYKWLGLKLKSHLLHIKPAKLNEIVAEASSAQSPVPTRSLRTRGEVLFSSYQDLLKNESEILTNNDENELPEIEITQPIDLLPLIPTNFYSQVKSTKWADRRDGLEALEKILMSSSKINTGDYSEVVSLLNNAISKDTNVGVVTVALKCVALLSKSLRLDFHAYSLATFKALLGKLKEKKQSVVEQLRETLYAVYHSASLEQISGELVENLANKNPNVRSEVALFLSRVFATMTSAVLAKKTFKPLMSALIKALVDQDASVRDNVAKALGSIYEVSGGTSPHFAGLDPQKLAKIKESVNASNDYNLRTLSTAHQTQAANHSNATHDARTNSAKKKVPDRTDANVTKMALNKINSSNRHVRSVEVSEEVKKALSDKHWSTKLGGISDLKETLELSASFPSDFSEITPLIASLISDINSKVAVAAISLVSGLVTSARASFRKHISTLLPSLLKTVGSGKTSVPEAAINCLDALVEAYGSKELFEGDVLCDILKTGSRITKVRLWKWLATKLTAISPKSVSPHDLTCCLSALLSCLKDRNKEVRIKAGEAVVGFVRVLGPNAVISSCKTLCKEPNDAAVQLIVEQCERIKSNPDNGTPTGLSEKTVKSSDANEVDENRVEGNNLKSQRTAYEEKCKLVNKQADFIEQLKSFSSTANLNKKLVNLMFHSGYKYQSEALDALNDELVCNLPGIISNLKIILQWTTLVDYAMLHKCLKIVFELFSALQRANYQLTTSEASAIVPHLLWKLHDSEETAQLKLKQILHTVSNVYSMNKLSELIIKETQSGDFRHRANCLQVLNSLMNVHSEVADNVVIARGIMKLVNDNDSLVRKSALEVVANCFDYDENKLLEFTGHCYSQKDGQYIQHIIREYFEGRRITKGASEKLLSVEHASHNSERSGDDNISQEISTIIPQVRSQVACYRSKASRAVFYIDENLLEEVECIFSAPIQPTSLIDVDIRFLKDDENRLRATKICKLLSRPSSSPKLTCSLKEIMSADVTTSSAAIKKFIDLLCSEEPGKYHNVIDPLIRQLSHKLEALSGASSASATCYEPIFVLLYKLSSSKFIEHFTEDGLYNILRQLLIGISDGTFDGTYANKANAVVLNIIKNTDETMLLCTLLRSIADTEDSISDNPKLHELFVKCLWKLQRAPISWHKDSDYPKIFNILDHFVRRYSEPWWKSKTSNIALRTVKTLLRSLMQTRIDIVMDYVKTTTDDNSSGLHLYLKRKTNHLDTDGANKTSHGSGKNSLESLNLSIGQARELSDIFKEMASSLPRGLSKLSEFVDVNPEVDIHNILSKLSPSMLNYCQPIIRKSGFHLMRRALKDGEPGGNFFEKARSMRIRLKILQDRIESPRS